MSKIQEIMLKRKLSVAPEYFEKLDYVHNLCEAHEYLNTISNDVKKVVLATTVVKNMETLGYLPSKELFDLMIADANVTYNMSLITETVLSKLKGAHVQYTPMYKDFPNEVMEQSEASLYEKALIHYITGGEVVPHSIGKKRISLDESVNYSIVNVASNDDCIATFQNILNSATPYKPSDILDIEAFLEYFNIYSCMPEFIVNRENLATLAKVLYDDAVENKIGAVLDLKPQIKSVTDVARIMNVIHGDGDVSLSSDKFSIKKITRGERRAYIRLLSSCKNINNDMKMRQGFWKRVGEVLHPNEYKNLMSSELQKGFAMVRDNSIAKTVRTYNSVAEEILVSGEKSKIFAFAKEKPGVIARNLDRMLRHENNKPDEILDIYRSIAADVAPALLWQVHSHFKKKIENYDDEDVLRIFVIKGTPSKTKLLKNNIENIDRKYYEQVIEITENALIDIYKEKPSMGKVYIAPCTSGIKIPNDTRGGQAVSVGISKGSRLPLDETQNTIRGFIWWTNLENHSEEGHWMDAVDMDLSALMIDENMNIVDRCSYYSLKGDYYTHSGDFVDGGDFDGQGVAEFVDVDIEKALENGVRYVCFTVHGFSGVPFNKAEHIHFGYMTREDDMANDIYNPATVKQCVKLNAPSVCETICCFDIVTKEMIWVEDADMSIDRYSIGRNVDITKNETAKVLYKALNIEKANLYDVIRINTIARGGEIVDNEEDAEIIFDFNRENISDKKVINVCDLAFISGELLPKDVSDEYLPKEENTETEEMQSEDETNETL